MTLVTLVELQGYDGTQVNTHRFASGLGYSHPSAPGWYEPALEQPADFKRILVADGGVSGDPTLDYGELRIKSPGGQFDYLLREALAGWPMTVKLVDSQAAYGTATTILTATVLMAETTSDMSAISITFLDPQTLLDTPIQLSTYGGTNALPNGVDGTAADIKGSYKPVCYGHVFNISPILVNTSCWIYQVADKQMADIPVVRVNGLPLSRGAQRGDTGSLVANVPAAGTYDYGLLSTGSYFRILSGSGGQVTCDVMEGANTGARTIAQVMSRMMQERAGVASTNISAADIAAVDALVSGEVGIWYGNSAANIRDATDKISQTGGVWYVPDELGGWRFGRIDIPAGVPAITLRKFDSTTAGSINDIDIISITRVAPTDQGYGVPAWSIVGNFAPCFTVQTSGLAGAVSASDVARLGMPWLQSTAQDATIKTAWPKAQTFTSNLFFTTRSDADAETARRLALYRVRRDRYTVICRLRDAHSLLGKVVRLVMNRADLATGKLFLVIGLMVDARTGNAELDLWG